MKTEQHALPDLVDSSTESPAPDSGAAPGRSRGDRARPTRLVSTIEGEIVPRLLMLRRSTVVAGTSTGWAAKATDPADVDELARLLIEHGPEMACAFVEAIHEQGVPYERICLQLLAPTARRLAERWENCDLRYPDLTLGLDALHAVVLEVSGAAKNDRRVSRGD